MERRPVPQYGQLKDLNARLFELQTRTMLLDAITTSIETKMLKVSHEMPLLEQLEGEMKDKEAILDAAIETDLVAYDRIVEAGVDAEFSAMFSEASASAADEEQVFLAHMFEMNNDFNELEKRHEKNDIVRAIKKMDMHVERYRKELRKLDDDVRRMSKKMNQERRTATDSLNKSILSMVTIWKERQVCETRLADNRKKYAHQQKENENLLVKIQNMEQGNRAFDKYSQKHQLIPVLVEIEPLNMAAFSLPGSSRSNSSAERSFDSVEMPSPTYKEVVARPVKETTPRLNLPDEIKNKSPGGKIQARTKERASLQERSPPKWAAPIPRKRSASTAFTPAKSASSEISPPAKEAPSPRPRYSPKKAKLMASPPITRRSVKRIGPIVISPPPSLPSSSLDLDHEFESFGSCSSEGNRSLAETDDMNDGSFFGGPSGAGDGDNWF